MKTRDIDIRNFLNSVILKKYKNDSDTKIINEFNVYAAEIPEST
jgi:hypothetical protein